MAKKLPKTTETHRPISEQVLSGLRYFCVSCAMAIAAIYFLMITWFLAWLTIDQRRMEDKRNAFVPCIKYAEWEPNKHSQKGYMKRFLQGLGRLLEFRVAEVSERERGRFH